MIGTSDREDRLKILFLPGWYPSEVKGSGGRFIREHAKAVSLFDDVVVVYAYNSPQEEVKGLYSVSEGMEDGVYTVRIRYRSPSPVGQSPISRLLRSWATLSYLHRFIRRWRPDVIHAHVYSAGVLGVVAGRLHGIPVVITEHWSWFVLRRLTWERRLAARLTMRRARMVLPVSEHLKKHMEEYGLEATYRIVPNVVNTQLFHPEADWRQHGDGTKRLLLVAVLSDQKGIMELLRALKQVREKRHDFSLDIVGERANQQTTRDYERVSRELGLDAVVEFHGAKPKQEVAQFMKRCHFFVQPSLQETFGIVYVEAMACGKPVIACDIPGPNEFITRDVGILVPPGDTDALAKAIDFMLDHWGDYSSDKIAEYARARFSYEVVGKKLDDVYREVIEK